MMSVLWSRVCSQAQRAGVSNKVDGLEFTPESIPKDLAKMAYFEPVLASLIFSDPSKVVGARKSAQEYLEGTVGPQTGAKPGLNDIAKDKQRALFGLSKGPKFSYLAQNYNPEKIWQHLERVRLEMSKDPRWQGNPAFDDLMAEWNLAKVHGGSNPAFIVGHMATIAGSPMPWSSVDGSGKLSTLPAPESLYEFGFKRVLDELLVADGTEPLRCGHLLIGSGGASRDYLSGYGCVTIANKSGAAGYPYTNMPADEARNLTSDGKRPTKANVAREELSHILAWLQADCPREGELWDRLFQPTTVWMRGDATVDYRLLAFAKALHDKGYPLLLMLLPGRGIAIVPTIQTLLELMFVQPFQQYLAVYDIESIDQRTKRFTQDRAQQFVRSAASGQSRVLGLDVSRWDLNMYPGEHAIEAAMLMRLFPEYQDILVGAPSLPGEWSEDVVRDCLDTLRPGESKEVGVVVPQPDGNQYVETVEVSMVRVNVHKLVAAVISLVNGSPVAMGGIRWDVGARKVDVPEWYGGGRNLESDRIGYRHVVEVGSCRRSGSGLTSMNNSLLNGIITYGGFQALRKVKKYSSLVRRAARRDGLEPITRCERSGLFDSIRRGDDQVFSTADRWFYKDGKEADPEVAAATAMSVFGRFGNPTKQRTGDWGVADFEFASVYYNEAAPRGITDPARSIVRSITVEGSGNDPDELTVMDVNERGLELGLISSTLTAKARLLPQRGGAQGTDTPGNEKLIKALASYDKYGLTYGTMDLTDNQLQTRLEAEARRYARREARKHNLAEMDQDDIEREYLDADMHWMLRGAFAARTARSAKGRTRGAAMTWWQRKVESLKD